MAIAVLKKTVSAENTTDAYDGLSLHVFYSSDNFVKGVEFFKGSHFKFRDIELLDKRFAEIKNVFLQAGEKLEFDDSGCSVTPLGLYLYVPEIDFSDEATLGAVYVDLL